MQYGFVIPTGEVRTIAELAHEAESAGWDGVFYQSRAKYPLL